MPPMNGPADPNHQAQPRAQPPALLATPFTEQLKGPTVTRRKIVSDHRPLRRHRMLTAPKSPMRGEQSLITEPLRVPSELAQGDRQIVQAAPSPPVSTPRPSAARPESRRYDHRHGPRRAPQSAEAAQPAPELRGKGRIPQTRRPIRGPSAQRAALSGILHWPLPCRTGATDQSGRALGRARIMGWPAEDGWKVAGAVQDPIHLPRVRVEADHPGILV